MMQNLWKMFPRLIEERINNLLEEAEPNRMKAYQIYKSCQNENLWQDSFAKFSDYLNLYFALPKSERVKSRFDIYLDRPMHKNIFEAFQLDFRNAVVNSRSLMTVASWAHNLMRINYKNCQVISTDVMTKTLILITNPAPFEKAQDIDFEDFCAAWKNTVFRLFGKKYELDVQDLLEELKLLDLELKNSERTQRFIPAIYLTQTEIDWTRAVENAAQNFKPIPHYPLTRGPQKPALVELLRVVQLYNIVFSSPETKLLQHQSSVRLTLLDRCQSLLRDRAA